MVNVSKRRPQHLVPFRVVGKVCSSVPTAIVSRGSEVYAISALERTFQIYDLKSMSLVFVSSPPCPTPIVSVAGVNDLTFVSCQNDACVQIFKRAKMIASLAAKEGSEISSLHILGHLILGVCQSSNSVYVWNWETQEIVNVITFSNGFHVKSMVHPSTYVNKMLFIDDQGKMQLWNIQTMTMLYEFADYGSGITAITQSPAIDVMALGLSDGRIILQNLRTGVIIKTFEQDTPITAIAFREDTSTRSLMISTSNQGHLLVWDLDEEKMVVKLDTAHEEQIHTARFLAGQPILLTSGDDNAMKQWIFDSEDGTPRLLKSRTGHFKPPTKVQFWGSAGTTLLSSGSDGTMRRTSTIKDEQNTVISQRSKKLGALIAAEETALPQTSTFDAAENHTNDWDTMLTGHVKSHTARTWSLKNLVLGSHVLPTTDNSPVNAVSVSTCGNFGFVGSVSGGIDMFNMQSGLLKKTFSGKNGHTKALIALQSDAVNRYLFSASLDGTVKTWDIQTGKVKHTLPLGTSVSAMVSHLESGILALACDDLGIRIIDTDTHLVIRELWGHRNRILDMAFSPDGRWLVSTSLDGTIRIWDLPTGGLLESIKTEPATSVSFSPQGNLIATTHVNNRGIQLWINSQLFGLVAGNGNTVLWNDEEDMEDLVLNMDALLGKVSNESSDNLVQLSSQPLSRVQLLLNLDTVKERNKPKEVKKPEVLAPFFLLPKSDLDPLSGPQNDFLPDSKIFGNMKMGEDDINTTFSSLTELSPAALDLEIRALSASQLQSFLELLILKLDKLKDFDVIQSALNIFLKVFAMGDALERTIKFIKERDIAANFNQIEEAVQSQLVPALKDVSTDATSLALKKQALAFVAGSNLENDELFVSLNIILDIAICLSEHSDPVLVDSALPMMLIEDLMDVLTIEGTSKLFEYIESRVERLTANMDPARGKGLVLLRFCNELLRRLSKAKNTVFCGRILIFLTSVYPLTERSGVNLRGDFNVDNVTHFETNPPADSDTMDIDDDGFYNTFWGLQGFWSNPLTIFQSNNWEVMTKGVEAVIKRFESISEQTDGGNRSSSDRDRKRKKEEKKNPPPPPPQASQKQKSHDFFFPKYLTSRNLFDLELTDPTFRRQILVQILIIFQFLFLLTPSHAPTIDEAKAALTNKSVQYQVSLTQEQESWVTSTRSRIMKVLEAGGTAGRRFATTVSTVITHEKNWIKWKEESCPSFEKTSEGLEFKKRRVEYSAAINKDYLGSEDLTRLWSRNEDPMDILREPDRGSLVKPLEEFMEPLAEQLTPEGEISPEIEEEYLMSKDKKFNWLSYRTAMRDHFYLFKDVDSIDTRLLYNKMKAPKEKVKPAAT
ncbi:hypothetical protein HDV05_007679 [Chytridiales sp. JEL 0842]|nr:hypothetical protein HDV05_007679 [Chytridiales sp. JEL 0842]